jgi:uncharacterized protein
MERTVAGNRNLHPDHRRVAVRTDIEFVTEDSVPLRGWFYRPKRGAGPFPTIVMAHGFSATKEMLLDEYAEVFADRGFAVLVYDHRNLGASGGPLRGELVPYEQIQDYRTAITFASELSEVDSDRIGIWGSSYSGGHVVVVGALDRRVKCVVSQVPFIGGFENTRRLVSPLMLNQLRESFDADRVARFRGEAPTKLAVVPFEEGQPAILNHGPAAEFFKAMVDRAPTWENSATLRSAELFMEYEPLPYLAQLGPKPFLLVVAAGDTIVPADIALNAFNTYAVEPKKAVVVPGEHFEIYTGDGFAKSSRVEAEWFKEWLL